MQITDFFDFEYEDFTHEFLIPEAVECVKFKRGDLLKLGFTEHYIKHQKAKIISVFASSGFTLFEVSSRNDGKLNQHQYFARNPAALDAHVLGKIIEVSPVESGL